MKNNVNLLAFGTFGNPNGFTQTFFIGTPELNAIVKAFDVRGSILIYPNSFLYAIRKEQENGYNIISYSVYTYAQEPTSTRGGSFIGSGILFTDKKVAEESVVVNCLNEFHSNLVRDNVVNDTITVGHSNDFSVKKPRGFDKLGSSLRDVEDLNFGQATNKGLMVYCKTDPNDLKDLFKKSLDLLNVYDVVYFTKSSEIATHVDAKGTLKLVQIEGFENERSELEKKRLRDMQEFNEKLHEEREVLEKDRIQQGERYNKSIANIEEAILEHQRTIKEFKRKLEINNQRYRSFDRVIEEFQLKLRDRVKLDDIKRLYDENKRSFISSIENPSFREPSYSRAVEKPRSTTSLKMPSHGRNEEEDNYDKIPINEGVERKKKIFKLALIGLVFLIVLGGFSFWYFNKEGKPSPTEKKTEPPIKSSTLVTQNGVETETLIDNSNDLHLLNPEPNSELNYNDLQLVIRSIKKNKEETSVRELVGVIFKKNPTDIGETYKGQETEYEKTLIEMNPESFKEKSGEHYLTGETLSYIPSYKEK